MLSQDYFIRILRYFDKELWEGKTTDTGWNYYGLILDYFFDNSILAIDYLSLNDYFYETTGYSLDETSFLTEQFTEVVQKDYCTILQSILRILKLSKNSPDHSERMIQTITNVLKRNSIIVVECEQEGIIIKEDDIFDSGYYCNISRYKDGILKKRLKSQFASDLNLQKRMRYEFENMSKLIDCPYILKVFEFIESEHSYLMEQAEMNLCTYMNNSVSLSLEEKVKIILCILNGMAYAHSKNIIHRDLHLGNILKINSTFVIADFGLSKDLSIERSLKTSASPMNSHIFIDPMIATDFTKADMKSDVYSIGKMIDYILTFRETSTDHFLKPVVERCICRNTSLRYATAEQVLQEVQNAISSNDSERADEVMLEKIREGVYDQAVHTYVLHLTHRKLICNYIVENRISDFGDLLIQFETIYVEEIMNEIHSDYAESTGYNQWHNYDLFIRMAYLVHNSILDYAIRKICVEIITECAEYRYLAQDILKKIIT